MRTIFVTIIIALMSAEVHSQNNSLNFDGKTWIVVPSHKSLNFSSQMTMEVWVRLPNTFPNQKIVGKSPIGSGYVLGVQVGKLLPEIWNGADRWNGIINNRFTPPYLDSITSGCVSGSQWTHLAVTFKQGEHIIMYTNGVEAYRIPVNNNPILPNTNDLFIGMSPFGPPAGFFAIGNLDEVALWNVARTPAQIRTDMLGSIAPTPALVAYYDFNQGVAGGDNSNITMLNDVSGNGHHGTLVHFDLNGNVSNFLPGFELPLISPSPLITGVSPGSGEVGSAVTINGTNFSAIPSDNIVRFNGIRAITVSSTPTTIITSVPPGAISGKITVQSDCNVSINSSNSSFAVTILPPLWKRWWAYTVYGLVFIGLLLHGRKEVIKRERRKFEIEMERKRIEALKESEQLKTKFFSNITHEFRTPLTLIQGPANELLGKLEDPESRHLAGLIKDNSSRLLKLINQLLDLAKLDANEMKLNKKDIDLSSFFRVIISQFSSLAALRNVHFISHLPDKLPTILTDDEKLETIAFNLISNALKFTPANGTVNFRIILDNNSILTLEVIDNGRGIPPKKLDHIFDRFYQVEPTDSSHAEGTGIGLALVKEYVEQLKGKIQVESQQGIGTRFSCSLPIIISLAKPLSPDTEPFETLEKISLDNGYEEDSQLPLLLLTEDNEDIRSFIKTCLGKNFRYREARDGREGLNLARQDVPDLIISDLMMPEMDGIEFCALIKKDKRTDHIPFIMLTAKASGENRLEGLHTGADDYVIKPFNKTELLLKIQNLLTLRRNLQTHIKNSILAQPTPVEPTSAGEQFVFKARLFVENRIQDDQLGVEMLASEMNLSREQCYRKIISLTGLPPSHFIRRIRLQRAAQLLESKWGSVSQVAYEVGFDNLSYFSKTFKEEFGKLPSAV